MEAIVCRCILVRRGYRTVLANSDGAIYMLPRVNIPRDCRPARQFQSAVKMQWGLDTFVLDHWLAVDGIECSVIAERMDHQFSIPFTEVQVGQISPSELSEDQRQDLEMLFEGRATRPLSQLGWADEAIAWIRATTGGAFSSRRGIEQWNAGAGFALFRVHSDNGQQYWLKATAGPNARELKIVRQLAELCPDFVPTLVGVNEEWNCWLTKDAGNPLPEDPGALDLLNTAMRFAQLQLITIGRTDLLLAAGAIDHRVPALRSGIGAVISYLIDAMARQTSTKVPVLSPYRIDEIGEMVREACFRMETLRIPDTLIHNDLNRGNILRNGDQYVFTDWSEAAIGNPFLSCERLCQLNLVHPDQVRMSYRQVWSECLSPDSIREAICLAPLLAIYACLYGRGDWTSNNFDVRFDSYARSLARRMDKAVRDAEVLCDL